MSINVNTPMRSVTLVYTFTGTPEYLKYSSDETPRQFDTLYVAIYPSAGASRDTLEILQQIYASADGFMDADGNAVIPTIQGDGETTKGIQVVAELENNGIANPLIVDYQHRRFVPTQFSGVLLQDGEITKDDDLDQSTILLKAKLELPDKAAPGTTFSQSLARIHVVRIGTRGYAWTIEFDESDEQPAGDLDELPLWIAFRAWLESIRISGPVVGLNPTADSTYNSRQYQTVIQNESGVDKTFQFYLPHDGIGPQAPLDENGFVDYFYVVLERQSTSPVLSTTTMNTHMDGLSIDITVDDTMTPVKQKITVDQVAATRIQSGDTTLEIISGVPVLERGPLKRVLGTGHGVQLHLDELSTNSDGDYLLSTKRDYEVLAVRDHADLSDSGDENVLVLPKPTDMLRYGPQNRPVKLEHPLKYGRAINVRFWDNTAAFWLRPGENVDWRWVREEDGSGRLEATDPPERLISFGGLESGPGSSLQLSEVLRITDFETGRTGYLVRNPIAPTTAPNRVDIDAFTLELTADYATYTLTEWEALATQFNMIGMWTTDRRGLLDVEILFDLFSSSGASGTFPGAHVELWTKLDATSNPIRLAVADPGVTLGGTRNTIPFFLTLRRYEAIAGQLFWHVITAPDSQSMSDNTVIISGHQRTIILNGEIIKEES